MIGHVSALLAAEPQSQSLSMFYNLTYEIGVRISGVDDVYGFQFDVEYDPDVFEVSGVSDISEGTFLNSNGQDDTYCLPADISIPGVIDNYACSRTGSTTGVNGSGLLADIEFKVKDDIITFPATSDIILSDVKVSDVNSQQLDNSTQNGQATVYQCLEGETRGCTINTCQGTRTCNSSNEWGHCTISGTGDESCDGIDNDCDGAIDNADGQGDYTLARSCSDLGYTGICDQGQATCGANGWYGCPEAGEEICENGIDEDCDGGDSTCSGDVVDDGCVDIQDLALIGGQFGKKSGDGDFDSRADIDDSGEVDIFDLVVIGKDYGQGPNCT